MISKERELLQRCAEAFSIHNKCPNLIVEIQNLLAQPEHIPAIRNMVEQEPVAWMYDHHIEVGYDKHTEFNIVETCARNLESENCINIRPLYASPPKQEPLSDETIAELWGDKYSGKTFMVKNFARAIEKAHGIGVDDGH